MQEGSDKGADGGDKNDAASPGAAVTLHPAAEVDPEKAKQEEEWRKELSRLEYEIQTLRSVLTVKIDEANELKRKLGITTMVELKQDFKQGIQTIKESETVKKTGAALKSFGDYTSKKLGDIRNSNTFKSMEEKVSGAYTSVKKRVSTTSPDGEQGEPLKHEEASSPTDSSAPVDSAEDLAAMLPEAEKPAGGDKPSY